jgi:hypothetical protein
MRQMVGIFGVLTATAPTLLLHTPSPLALQCGRSGQELNLRLHLIELRLQDGRASHFYYLSFF